MFRSRTKRQRGQHQGLDPILPCRFVRGRQQDGFGEPGVMVDGEVGTLLLGATGRHQGEPARCSPVVDFLVGQRAVLHTPPLLLVQRLMFARVAPGAFSVGERWPTRGADISMCGLHASTHRPGPPENARPSPSPVAMQWGSLSATESCREWGSSLVILWGHPNY